MSDLADLVGTVGLISLVGLVDLVGLMGLGVGLGDCLAFFLYSLSNNALRLSCQVEVDGLAGVGLGVGLEGFCVDPGRGFLLSHEGLPGPSTAGYLIPGLVSPQPRPGLSIPGL